MRDSHMNADDEAPKSEGQQVLERLLAVREHMSLLDRQLVGIRDAIGIGPGPGQQPGEARTGGGDYRQFLPALHVLADQMETALGNLARNIDDIAKAF